MNNVRVWMEERMLFLDGISYTLPEGENVPENVVFEIAGNDDGEWEIIGLRERKNVRKFARNEEGEIIQGSHYELFEDNSYREIVGISQREIWEAIEKEKEKNKVKRC